MPHYVRMSILKKYNNIKWTLFAYDVVIVVFVELLLLVFSGERVDNASVVYHILTTIACVLTARFAEKGIWVSCLLLAVSFLMMFVREEEKK